MISDSMEQHFTTTEVAERWNVTAVTVIRLFRDQPGVLRLGSMTARRRTRSELRIPKSVVDRVYAERLSHS
jgi:hypothetical protein